MLVVIEVFLYVLLGGFIGAIAMALFCATKPLDESHLYHYELKSFLRKCTTLTGDQQEVLTVRKQARKLVYQIYEEGIE